MLIEARGKNGHYFYSHDYLGNCSKITDYYGNEIKFEYSPLCELLVEEYCDGTTKSYEYSLSGIKRKIRRNERELYSSTFDNGYLETKTLGGINRIKMNKDCSEVDTSFYDTGNYHTERTNQNYYSVTDEVGNSYIYETDKYGQVIKEKNPLGYISKFNYTKDGKILEKENYSGIVEKYDYDVENRTTTIEYSTGEKIEFINDENNNLVKLNTNNYSLEFEYDKRGNLISEYSVKTNTKINYFYDDYSRCIRKSGANFSFAYFYDEMSRLMKVKDEMSDNWIEFEYDNFLRVKNKKYSNGMESSYGYNEYGQLEYSITKNNLGLILAGEFLLYDNLGRISIKSDASGNVTKYKYDERSRLISTEYPYTEERKDAYLDEATECGYYILEENPSVGNISLNHDEIVNIRKLYEKAGVNSYITINTNQKTWLEKYDYSKTGSIKSVINPYGEIVYEYDNLNRLISKNYKSSNNNGIKLKWNKDNLLEEIISAKRKMSFSYGEIKRPKSIKIEDYVEDSCDIVEYLYDGLGRRVLEKTYDKNIEYIYDGFSTVLLSRQNITNNDFISSVYKDSSYKPDENISILNNNYDTESVYRKVDNNKYKPFGQFQKNSGDKNENKTRDYNIEESITSENCNILSFGKAPCIISYNDNSKSFKKLADFVLTDYKYQIIGTVNNISDFVEYNEFDTWGNCILTDGNKDNCNNFIIDFGYRDYIPLLKTFTSEDPVRDGKNWFAYCPCDSVNYFDDIGFAKQSLSYSDNLLYQSYIYSFLNFNELYFHDPSKRDRFNRYMGLYGAFDCTDNAISVCHLAMRAAELMENDEYMKKLSQAYTVDNYVAAKAVACSRDIYEGRMGRKVCDGVDNEFIKRVNEGKSEFDTNSTEYKEEMAKRDRVNKCLQNPDIIKPGSVLVWKDSEHNRTYKDGFPSSCGHVVTVLSREFDENGNIVGIIVIEGHTKGERTELTYLDVRDIAENTSVHDYRGEFAGVYEMESADAEKYEPVCVM